MIQPIHWLDIELGRLGKYNSPFQRRKRERILKLTFHTSALENLSKDDTDACNVQIFRPFRMHKKNIINPKVIPKKFYG